jgi:hypothetical protein
MRTRRVESLGMFLINSRESDKLAVHAALMRPALELTTAGRLCHEEFSNEERED